MTIRALLQEARDVSLRLALSSVAREVLAQNLTYLSAQKLRNLEHCVRRVDRDQVPGDFIECGVALGGSAIVLASKISPGRQFSGYDVFATIPPPSARDDEHAHRRYQVIRTGGSRGIGGERYYGYIGNLFDVVVENFDRFGLKVDGGLIALRRGLFEDTLAAEPRTAVALAHIDCDWHDPVRLCLNAIYDRLAPGGFIILDDYHDYGGCRRATDAFLAERPDMNPYRCRGNMVLRRDPPISQKPAVTKL